MKQLIDNKGDQLYTTIYPQPAAETVLLLHGGPGFPSNLVEVVAALRKHYQVVTFHQRGTALSPCPSGNYSMEAYLSDVEAVRTFYGIDTFHLWGHSWGGLYAQIYAETYPGRLKSLFLCCPGSGTNGEWQQTEKEVMQLNRAKCTSWQWAQMGLNNLLGMLGSDAAYKRLFRQVMKNYNDDFIATTSLGEELAYLKAAPINKTRPQILQYPLLKKMSNPPFPITIVYGDRDIYKESKNFVLQRYPTAQVHTIPQCGHIPWLHNRAYYNGLLQQHYKINAAAPIQV